MANRIYLDEPQPKQHEFLIAQTRFVAFGGARGGGKSWAVRAKAAMLGVYNPGIKILLLRKTYPELKENHILPLSSILKEVATYKEVDKVFEFINGSRIKLGYLQSDKDVLQYQGQEYDIIFMDEATHFSEFMFKTLTASLRGVNKFPKRFYLTCNPGGIGHEWVKRLFVTRKYKDKENPKDYTFIQSRVYDNKLLMESDPEYVKMLENLPEKQRKAWLEGDWDIFDGKYFGEFNYEKHTCEPFKIPKEWRIYRTLDYGLDMLACYWIAVDGFNNVYVTKELCESDLPISTAAEKINAKTYEDVDLTLAPPDLWNRSQESGKSRAILFEEAGLTLIKSNNDREAGWLAIKELLKPNKSGEPRLKIFRNCVNLIDHLPALQHDEKKPSDCADKPHDITHSPDALRYFAIYWTYPAEIEVKEQTTTLPFELQTDERESEEYIEW